MLREGNHYVDDPTTSISELTKDVLEVCRRNLAGFKMPRSLEIIAEIPRTLAAKVDRKRALAEYLDRHAQQSG